MTRFMLFSLSIIVVATLLLGSKLQCVHAAKTDRVSAVETFMEAH